MHQMHTFFPKEIQYCPYTFTKPLSFSRLRKTSIFQMDCLEIQNSHSGAEWREFSSFSNRTFWLERKFSVKKTPEFLPDLNAIFQKLYPGLENLQISLIF